jgi:hypothetical protein
MSKVGFGNMYGPKNKSGVVVKKRKVSKNPPRLFLTDWAGKESYIRSMLSKTMPRSKIMKHIIDLDNGTFVISMRTPRHSK